LLALSFFFVAASLRADDEPPSSSLRISSIQTNGWVRISGRGIGNAVVTLEASSNLLHWQTVAVMHDDYPEDDETRFTFADPVSARSPKRFYRFRQANRTSADDWKNQIHYGDSFIAPDQGSWVKFTILLDDPTRVYYANGLEYLFHYDFATTRLEPLQGVGYEEFQRIAFYNDGRRVVVGTVIFAPPEGVFSGEYAIQSMSEDPLPRELVRDLFHLVRSTVVTTYWGPADHLQDGLFYMSRSWALSPWQTRITSPSQNT
jgi:hypothetical protein